jgi:hypothetical protein
MPLIRLESGPLIDTDEIEELTRDYNWTPEGESVVGARMVKLKNGNVHVLTEAEEERIGEEMLRRQGVEPPKRN